MKRIVVYLILLIASTSVQAKGIEVDSFLVQKEAEINAQLEKLRLAKDDNARILENESLKELIEPLLSYPGVFDYPFDAFQTMSTITSPDGAFRLFNWNIEDNNGMNTHYCYMVRPTRGNKPNQVIEFKEDHITLPPRPDNMLTAEHWYGALYYKIIPVRSGSKTMYTVIGYSGGTRSTNKKLLDVFFFKGKKLRMGYPIFQESQGSKRLLRRVFFEHSEKVTIAVNVNERLDAIVFDHLIPETPDLEGMYQFYVPDMTYDAYRWEGNMWKYEEDKVAVNEENKKTRLYNPDGDNGGKEFVEVKDEWEDPVDGNPNGGGTNAVAPVEENQSDAKKGKGRASKKDKKQRRGWFFKRKKKNKPQSAIGQ